jgi:hypothetical protein
MFIIMYVQIKKLLGFGCIFGLFVQMRTLLLHPLGTLHALLSILGFLSVAA